MVRKHKAARISTGGHVPRHPLAPRGAQLKKPRTSVATLSRSASPSLSDSRSRTPIEYELISDESGASNQEVQQPAPPARLVVPPLAPQHAAPIAAPPAVPTAVQPPAPQPVALVAAAPGVPAAALGGDPDDDSSDSSNAESGGNNNNHGGPGEPGGHAPQQPGPGARRPCPIMLALTHYSNGERGGPVVTRFHSMLTRLDFDALPVYYSKVVYRPGGRKEWRTTVHVLNNRLVYRKISGTSFRATREEAEADAAWRATTTISRLYEAELQDTPFRYLPRRTSRTNQMTVATTEAFVSLFQINKTKDALLDLSLDHEKLLEDHQRVLNQLARSESLVRAYRHWEAAGTSELHSSGARTWSATSSRRRGSVNQQLEGDNDADSQA